MKKVIEHYDEKYFNLYQKNIGMFGGKANLFKYQKFIKKSDIVLDFGCGGGFLLSNLVCDNKIGIEINEIARLHCISLGINCYKDIDLIDDNSIDVIISGHCLEHTLSPHYYIDKFYKKLKKGGRVIIVVPTDSYKIKYKPNDVNYHLYSFSPMNLGNLLNSVGFSEIKVETILHKWPPFYFQIQKYLGWKTFHILSLFYGYLRTNVVQIRAFGVKK
jgi:SAM-dependent methyltransferase